VKLRADSGWRSVPGYGAVGVQNAGNGPALIRRTPLREGKLKWTYTIERPGADILHQGEGSNWNDTWFDMSPVTESVCSGRDTGYLLWGLPPDSEVVFTLARPIALLRRDLVIPNIRLADYIVR
jgi:hypothetical protein